MIKHEDKNGRTVKVGDRVKWGDQILEVRIVEGELPGSRATAEGHGTLLLNGHERGNELSSGNRVVEAREVEVIAHFLETQGQWTLMYFPHERYSEARKQSERGEVKAMGVCERCGGNGLEPLGAGKGHNGSNLCRRCGGYHSMWNERFGYDVDVYPAEVERDFYSETKAEHVKPAEVSMGSIGSVSATDARLRARLLQLAADIAELHTLRLTTEFNKEA